MTGIVAVSPPASLRPSRVSNVRNDRSVRSTPRYLEIVSFRSLIVTAVRNLRKVGIGLVSRGTKIAAWIRSSGTEPRDSDPRTRKSVLIARLHMTPWLSGSPTVPNRACGRSASKPRNPLTMIGVSAGASDGNSSV